MQMINTNPLTTPDRVRKVWRRMNGIPTELQSFEEMTKKGIPFSDHFTCNETRLDFLYKFVDDNDGDLKEVEFSANRLGSPFVWTGTFTRDGTIDDLVVDSAADNHLPYTFIEFSPSLLANPKQIEIDGMTADYFIENLERLFREDFEANQSHYNAEMARDLQFETDRNEGDY